LMANLACPSEHVGGRSVNMWSEENKE